MATLVLNKVFQVLDVLANSETPGMTLADLARETGIPKATLHRLLVELSERNVLSRSDNAYCLGTRLFELGGQVPRYRAIRQAALPHMQDLYERGRCTISLAVLEGTQVLYLHKMYNHDREYGPSRVGSRLPAYSTATGKAILARSPRERVAEVMRAGLRRLTGRTIVAPGLFVAQLERIRQSGIAWDDEETVTGTACVGSAIRGADGLAVAALAVGATPMALRRHYASAAVLEAAEAISADLTRLAEHSGFPALSS